MIVTCHSKTLLSSTSPAENPSTGFFARSATTKEQGVRDQEPIGAKKVGKQEAVRIRTLELLLEQEARLASGARHGKEAALLDRIGARVLAMGSGSPPPGRSCFISGGESSFGIGRKRREGNRLEDLYEA